LNGFLEPGPLPSSPPNQQPLQFVPKPIKTSRIPPNPNPCANFKTSFLLLTPSSSDVLWFSFFQAYCIFLGLDNVIHQFLPSLRFLSVLDAQDGSHECPPCQSDILTSVFEDDDECELENNVSVLSNVNKVLKKKNPALQTKSHGSFIQLDPDSWQKITLLDQHCKKTSDFGSGNEKIQACQIKSPNNSRRSQKQLPPPLVHLPKYHQCE
jgi:hypothetical protein